jgi:hypothetical protein
VSIASLVSQPILDFVHQERELAAFAFRVHLFGLMLMLDGRCTCRVR